MISANAVTRSRSDDSVDMIVVDFYLYIYIVVLSHVSSLFGYLLISNINHVSGIKFIEGRQ